MAPYYALTVSLPSGGHVILAVPEGQEEVLEPVLAWILYRGMHWQLLLQEPAPGSVVTVLDVYAHGTYFKRGAPVSPKALLYEGAPLGASSLTAPAEVRFMEVLGA